MRQTAWPGRSSWRMWIPQVIALSLIGLTATAWSAPEKTPVMKIDPDEFITAASDGNWQRVELLLRQGVDINVQNEYGTTGLMSALMERPLNRVKYHRPDLSLWLLAHGADVNIKDKDGDTALLWVPFDNYDPITRIVIDKTKDVNVADGQGFTPLHKAANNKDVKSVQQLLEKGARVDVRDKSYGETPLFSATTSYGTSVPGATIIVAWLLDYGADPNIPDFEGITPLIASARVSMEQVRLLLAYGANINARTKLGNTGLNLVAQSFELMMYKALARADARERRLKQKPSPAHSNESADSGKNHTAVNSNRRGIASEQESDISDMLIFFLEKGADPNIVNNAGEAPLLNECKAFFDFNNDVVKMTFQAQQIYLHSFSYKTAVNALKHHINLLLAHKADINAQDKHGESALTWIARAGQVELLQLLLQHGAKINQQNREGDTPLMLAASENHPDTVRLLLHRGADVRLQNRRHQTAAQVDAQHHQAAISTLLRRWDRTHPSAHQPHVLASQ